MTCHKYLIALLFLIIFIGAIIVIIILSQDRGHNVGSPTFLNTFVNRSDTVSTLRVTQYFGGSHSHPYVYYDNLISPHTSIQLELPNNGIDITFTNYIDSTFSINIKGYNSLYDSVFFINNQFSYNIRNLQSSIVEGLIKSATYVNTTNQTIYINTFSQTQGFKTIIIKANSTTMYLESIDPEIIQYLNGNVDQTIDYCLDLIPNCTLTGNQFILPNANSVLFTVSSPNPDEYTLTVQGG